MKRLFLILIAIVFVAQSCTKSHNNSSVSVDPRSPAMTFMNTGVIKGPSLFMNDCTAAFLITINGVDSFASFNALPAGSGIDLSTATFPLNVKLNWHHLAGNPCGVIVIDAIAAD